VAGGIAFAMLLGLGLTAQDRYFATHKDQKSCPRVEDREELLLMASADARQTLTSGANGFTPCLNENTFQPNLLGNTTAKDGSAAGPQLLGEVGVRFFPPENRRDVSTFQVLDGKGDPRAVLAARGKVVVIGFWQTACEPSVNLLQEMAELQPKGEKFGFEVWPVNFDSERWQKVRPFVEKQANRAFFQKTRILLPGIGATGPNLLMASFPSLPALFIIDRQGRLAFAQTGYEPNLLLENLKKVLVER
jgi:hypothetical protein